MKPFAIKWIGGILLMFLSLLNLQAQTDTLCNPNENRKIFGELYFNYGSVTNAFSQFNRSTFIVGQPLSSPENMLAQNYQGGFGVYSPWYLPPQPPVLVATQGDFKDRIRISWNVNPLSPTATGFVIYRDGSFLADLGENVRDYLDFNTQAGEYYEYSIEAKNVFGTGSASKYVGFVNPNGVVSGKISTNSGNPVPGVEVRLTPLTGSSMAFDGVDDELCVSYNDKLPTDKFTVSAYVKFNTANDETGIIDWGSTLKKNWWITTTKSNEARGYIFHVGNGVGSDSLKYYLPNTITNPENINKWHQITMVYNGSALSVMVDGEFVGTKPASISRTKNYLNIGSKIGDVGFFKGNIDDVRIYNRPLTQTEVQSTKDRSVSKDENGLVAYWKMDEGVGQKVFDSSKLPTNASIYGLNAKFSTDIPEVYNAGISDVTGYYAIDGINYSTTESFRATPMKNFEFNSAVEFNAADKSYGNLTDFDMPDTATVEVLFYPFDLKSRQTVLSKGNLYELYVDNSKLYLKLNGSLTDLGVIKAKYYHVGVAMNNTNGTAKVYLEGALAATVSFTGTSNWATGNPWLMATNSTDATTGKFYTGLVDEFAIYKTALLQNQIQQHFTTGIPQDTTATAKNLFTYFDLNEGSDTKVYDYAAINFGATLPREGTLTKANWSSNARRKATKPHEFEPNVRVVNLNTSNTAVGNIDFKDVSTVNVSGTVRFENTFCFQDSVEIKVNGKSNFPQTFTDKKGKWSMDFEPGVNVKLTAEYKKHLFTPSFFELRKLQAPKAGIVFINNTKRMITGVVAGGLCKKSIIPSGSRVVVKAATLDGCFEVTDTIRNAAGKFTLKDLPARAFRVSVVELLHNSVIYNYLQVKGGREVDLRNTPKDSVEFIYIAPPQIEATPIGDSLCPTLAYRVIGRKNYTTTIKVYEQYAVSGKEGRCYVDDAPITILDGIRGLTAKDTNLTKGYYIYKTAGGEPNLLPPYTKKIEIATLINGARATLENPLEAIVLGEKTKEGKSFTSVSKPIIVDILRDPPGDNSYAWREAGTKSCKSYTTSITKSYGDSQGLIASFGPKFSLTAPLIGVGVETEVKVNSTNKWTKTNTYANEVSKEVCYTNTNTISTSTGQGFVGKDGDVFIGTTQNIEWGLSDNLIFDKDSCKVKIQTKLSVDDKGFGSDFQYSRFYIEKTLLPDLLTLAKRVGVKKIDSTTYMKTYSFWKNALKDEDNRKLKSHSSVNKTLTIDAGASYQTVVQEEINDNSSSAFTYDYDFSSDNEGGVLVGGIGGSLTIGITYNVNAQGTVSSANTGSKSYGYLISDDDIGDFHAIGVSFPNRALNKKLGDITALKQMIKDDSNDKNDNPLGDEVIAKFNLGRFLPDQVLTANYPAPIFTLFAGETKCPWEPGTIPKQEVAFTTDRTILSNVPANTAAVFELNLGNLSKDFMVYEVSLAGGSNPNGAIVKLAGQPLTTAFASQYSPKSVTKELITIERPNGQNSAYDFKDLTIEFYSPCEVAHSEEVGYDIAGDTIRNKNNRFYKSIPLEIHFIEPCSRVDISSPLQNFVLTPAQGDTLAISLSEYNKVDPDLKLIRLQYRPIGGDGSWINISETPKADLDNVNTIKKWNTGLNKDGEYEIRAVAECFSPTLQPGISTVIKGEIARNPPELVGVPEPGDGTWDPGDEISITFNEPINCDKVVQADILGNNTIGLYDATTNKLVDARISCVGNKIIIIPNINPVFFENRTFRVVVAGKDYDDAQLLLNPNHQAAAIRDKAGNRIPTTIKWEFAVNQNNLEWVGTDVIETNEVLKPFSVKRQIRNRGGSITSFRMEGIPSWLTVSPATGTLNPGQVADVTLTFQQDLLIGDYLDTLQMVGSKGAEPLLIDYRVRCPQPKYEVTDPEQYEGTMNMVVDLSIFGISSTDPSDVIVAKIDGQIRGVGRVAYYRNIPADKQRWLTFLTIFGKSEDEDKPIEFTIWNGRKCNQYVEILENYIYRDGSLVGSPLVPTPVSVLNLVKKCIPLNRGFNSVSFNLNLGTGRNTVNNMLSSLKNKTGAYIKTDNSFAQYLPNYGWDALDSLIYPTKRYMVYVLARDTVCIKGSPYEAKNYPIAIKNSWNWIGYVPSTGMTVTQALRGLTPLNGDIIKSQTLFAQYVAGVGWIGNLNFLEPLKGYLLKISNAGTLTYPTTNAPNTGLTGANNASDAEVARGVQLQSLQETPLTFDYTQYEQTMNLIGKVNGMAIDDEDELRAYIDGVLVGTNKAIVDKKQRLFFQTIYYQDEQNIQFKLFKADRRKEFSLDKTVVFKAETLAGLVENPIVFNVITSPLPPVTIKVEDNVVIKQPVILFPTVSIPASVVESTANCTSYSVNTILPTGTETKPTCSASTLEASISTVIKMRFNERTGFVSNNDVLTFINPATNTVVGCATFNTNNKLFYGPIAGPTGSTPVPLDVRYFSNTMKKSFTLKSAVTYVSTNPPLGNALAPYELNLAPLSVSITNGIVTAVMRDTSWTGSYGINVFALDCSGYGDGQATFNFYRLKSGDCIEVIDRKVADIENKDVQAIKITSQATINSGLNINYQGGNLIELKPGFDARMGAVFKGQIGGCNNK